MWLHSSVGRTSHRYRGGHGLESRWSPDLFQACSFQLLKLENLLRWSLFAFVFVLDTTSVHKFCINKDCCWESHGAYLLLHFLWHICNHRWGTSFIFSSWTIHPLCSSFSSHFLRSHVAKMIRNNNTPTRSWNLTSSTWLVILANNPPSSSVSEVALKHA